MAVARFRFRDDAGRDQSVDPHIIVTGRAQHLAAVLPRNGAPRSTFAGVLENLYGNPGVLILPSVG